MNYSIYDRVREWIKQNPAKVTCKYCNDIRYYSHTCFYEDRCPNCKSIAFDCRSYKHIPLEEVPTGKEIRGEWA